jgi:DNA-3-methyladenine glycosylase II
MRKAISHLRQADPVLARIIDRYGPCRIQHFEPDFALLARSIISQQLSGKAAATIYGRLQQALHPKPLSAAGLLHLTPEHLRSLGLSKQKIAYLRDLADKTRARSLRLDRLPRMTDEEVVAHLTAVKGIGVWTAQMVLIFALRRPDVLPTGDLGIRNAIQKNYNLEAAPTPAKMEEIARPWRPYASIACWYLWRSLENRAAL